MRVKKTKRTAAKARPATGSKRKRSGVRAASKTSKKSRSPARSVSGRKRTSATTQSSSASRPSEPRAVPGPQIDVPRTGIERGVFPTTTAPAGDHALEMGEEP